MKLEKGVLICSFLLVILLGVVSAESTCIVRTDSCSAGETAIIKLSSVQNAQGELASQNNYKNILCCAGISSTTCTGTNEILRLSSNTNAHAESPASKYSDANRICASGLSCVAAGSCTSGKNAILSLSSSTNAHLSGGDDSKYTTKICCDVATVIVPTFCRDGVTQNPNNAGQIEECDDGNTNNTDRCSNSCSNAKCGDGIVQPITGEKCESPTANCVSAGQTGECKCKSEYESNSNEGCVKMGGPDPEEIIYCKDVKISSYDNADILDEIGDICGDLVPPQSETLNINGCEFYSKCVWKWTNKPDEEGVCETKPEEMVDPSAKECKIVSLSNCDWTENVSGSCDDPGVSSIEISYKVISGDPIKCAIASNTVPCQEISLLPFFGFYQVIISLSIISIIYSFLIYRKSRKNFLSLRF